MNRESLRAINCPFSWSETRNKINYVSFQREISSNTLNEILPPLKDLTQT